MSGVQVHLTQRSRRRPRVELYKNVFQIQSLFGGRNLFQYLFAGANFVLVDTGIATTPEETILPYLDRLKISPERLTLVVVTHPDLDHQGGNDAMKRAAPRACLACGLADRALVEDPRALFDQRYNFLKEDHGVGFDPDPWPEAGKPRRVDLCFAGGESIRVADDWELEVLHVPGHSRGHLALYDRKKNPQGLTLKELIDAVADAVGDWPADSRSLAMFPVKGHLDRLVSLGGAQALRGARPVKWVKA